LAISEWAINEGLAAIDRKHRRGEMTIEERDKIIPEVLRKTRSLALIPISSWFKSRVQQFLPRPG